MPKLELLRALRGRTEVIATFTILQVIFVVGVIGFMTIEGYSFVEAFYMTSITLSTVGYGEVVPLSAAGRLFTVMLITVGVISIAAFVTAVTRAVLMGQLDRYMGRRRLMKEIARLKNHFIVCGYGRMGRIICQELRKKGVPFVVIERNPAVFITIEEQDLGLQGDATQDQVLIDAGINEAQGLVSVVSSDADNVYIILTARGLSGGAYLVARAGEEGSENKLLRAGADRVVSPASPCWSAVRAASGRSFMPCHW
jgi:voltage-gated potassium channel